MYSVAWNRTYNLWSSTKCANHFCARASASKPSTACPAPTNSNKARVRPSSPSSIHVSDNHSLQSAPNVLSNDRSTPATTRRSIDDDHVSTGLFRLVRPKILEPLRRELCVAHGVRDVFVAKIV